MAGWGEGAADSRADREAKGSRAEQSRATAPNPRRKQQQSQRSKTLKDYVVIVSYSLSVFICFGVVVFAVVGAAEAVPPDSRNTVVRTAGCQLGWLVEHTYYNKNCC